jgi:translation initiation factor 2 subunit 2
MAFEYEQLLKKAIEKIPKKMETKDRFKIPEADVEFQGTKTVVKNFNEIYTVLRRKPDQMAKFLFKQLATPGSIQGNNLVLQAKVSRGILQKKIEEYVKNFVYCKVCGEPDTKLVKEDRIYFMICEACGARSPVRSI